ncbi:MAG: LCP family protein [Treponemataceae bacterium]
MAIREKSFFALVIILVILVVTSVVLYFTLQTDPVAEVLTSDQLLNVLFVLEDEGKPLFTYVLIYYPPLKRGALFDIPENTGLIIRSLNRVDRIDAVFEERGIDAYKTEIERLTGITIPFRILMNVDELSNITDLLGGLKVFIPYPIDAVNDGVHYLLPSGAVALDGDKVVSYVTYDFEENSESTAQERRQNTLIALLWGFKNKANIVFSRNIFSAITANMRSNLGKADLKNLLRQIIMIDSERLLSQTVTGSLREVDGKRLLFPFYDGQLIKDIFKQTMSALVASNQTAHNRTYVLEVQNGTNIQGFARNTASLLQSFGYDVLSTVNANASDYEYTMIIDHVGNEEVAQSIGQIIRCDMIVGKDSDAMGEITANLNESMVDFTIILGKDFDGRFVTKQRGSE